MGSIPGWEDPLEEEMTTHSSILATSFQRNLAGYSRAAALDRTEPCVAGRPGAQGSVSPPLPRTRVLTLLSRAGLSPGLWPIEGETANIASWQKVQCPATLGLSSA